MASICRFKFEGETNHFVNCFDDSINTTKKKLPVKPLLYGEISFTFLLTLLLLFCLQMASYGLGLILLATQHFALVSVYGKSRDMMMGTRENSDA